jgi:hypothetical protein
MHNLWGEEIQAQQKKLHTSTRSNVQRISLTAQDCLLYGHSWTPAGMSGEKLCTVCSIKGYCPVCTPLNKSPDAQPFVCTRHSEGMVQA